MDKKVGPFGEGPFAPLPRRELAPRPNYPREPEAIPIEFFGLDIRAMHAAIKDGKLIAREGEINTLKEAMTFLIKDINRELYSTLFYLDKGREPRIIGFKYVDQILKHFGERLEERAVKHFLINLARHLKNADKKGITLENCMGWNSAFFVDFSTDGQLRNELEHHSISGNQVFFKGEEGYEPENRIRTSRDILLKGSRRLLDGCAIESPLRKRLARFFKEMPNLEEAIKFMEKSPNIIFEERLTYKLPFDKQISGKDLNMFYLDCTDPYIGSKEKREVYEKALAEAILRFHSSFKGA